MESIFSEHIFRYINSRHLSLRLALKDFFREMLFCILFAIGINPNSLWGKTTIEPFVARGFGSTLFRFQLSDPITGDFDSLFSNASVLGQSELEYPIDVFNIGLKLKVDFAMGEKTRQFFLGGRVNVTQPILKMEDSDWVGMKFEDDGANISVLSKYSYTQSDTKMIWIGAEIGLGLGYFNLWNRKTDYGILLMVDYFSFEMFGLTGWQRPYFDQPSINVASHNNQLVLTYRLIYFNPEMFFNMVLKTKPKYYWNLMLAVSPATLAFDHDDHVLRNKNMDTFAYGFSLSTGTSINIRMTNRYEWVMGGDLKYIRIKGKMDQFFYGDDPGTSDNETGIEIRGIDNLISSFTQQVYFKNRFEF